MRKLLIVAYYFPPSGGPGVQRVLKHVKYLPDYGWEPIVLTVENGNFPARDESLLKQVAESVVVKRSRIYEPYDLYRLFTGRGKNTAIDVNNIKKDSQKRSFKDKIAEFVRSTFFIPDARMAWKFTAIKAARQILREHKIDAVYSSSPPYTCSLIAKKISFYGRVPWVAGFRDPWTGFLTTPKRWFLPRAIDIKMEKSVFEEADAVEAAWLGIIKDALSKYPLLNSSKFHHIPNGFDSSDFPEVESKQNDRFTVTYTGSLYGRRNPQAFFKAIDNLIERQELDPGRIRLRFVGRFGSEVEEMFKSASFSDKIETVSYVPHKESIKYLMQSDALLLIVDEAKESEEIVPGKVYEYIGVMKPVIAIGPERSAIGDLLKETGCGRIAHQSDIENIASIIKESYDNWKTRGISFSPNEEAVRSYERKEAAAKLAALLDSLIDKH